MIKDLLRGLLPKGSAQLPPPPVTTVTGRGRRPRYLLTYHQVVWQRPKPLLGRQPEPEVVETWAWPDYAEERAAAYRLLGRQDKRWAGTYTVVPGSAEL